MLNNYVVGSQKFTLFVDEIGLEKHSSEIIETILKDQNVVYRKFPDLKIENFESNLQDLDEFDLNLNERTSLILAPFSKLAIHYKISAVIELIYRLKGTKNVKQIFGWLTVKNTNNHLLQPFLEHIADTIITLNSEKLLTVVVKRSHGVVKTKQYCHDVLNKTFAIKEFKVEQKAKDQAPIDIEALGTFKIGQFKENELEAKKSLQLPFEYK